jgi:hypothetical protein
MRLLLLAPALLVLGIILAAGGGIALIGAWLKSRPCEKCTASGQMCEQCIDDEMNRMGW